MRQKSRPKSRQVRVYTETVRKLEKVRDEARRAGIFVSLACLIELCVNGALDDVQSDLRREAGT